MSEKVKAAVLRERERTQTMSKKPDGFYEVLEEIVDVTGEERLVASFTPNNGIRVGIANAGLEEAWAEFDFTDEQAEIIGQALVRWAQRRRAEAEMIRVWPP